MSHACRLRLPDGSKAFFFLGAAVTDNLVGRVWVAEIDRIKNQNLHTVVMGKGLQIRVRGRFRGSVFVLPYGVRHPHSDLWVTSEMMAKAC